MARKYKSSRVKEILKTSRHAEEEISSLWHSIREKPWQYGIGTAVVVAALLFTVGYQQHTKASNRTNYTAYAKAIEAEDPAGQEKELESAVAAGMSTPEVLYMMGETAIKAGEYDKAKSALERLRQEHPESKFVPDAVEAIGFIAQEAEDYDAALKAYNEVSEKWPQSFAARRQALNLARVYEAQGNLEGAVKAYQDQTRQFPNSSVAKEAEMSLSRLRESNPELFAEEAAKTPPAETSPVTPPAETPAEAAPVAPSAETPAEAAPAASPAEGGGETDELPEVSKAPKLVIPDAAAAQGGADKGAAEQSTPAEPASAGETQPATVQ